MKNIYKYLWVIGLLLFINVFCVSCSKEPEQHGKVIAEVNGFVLYEEELRSVFTEEEWMNASNEEKQQVIDQWVNITLLAEEARKRKLNERPDVVFDCKYSEQTILANAVLADELKKIQVSDEDIFNYYNMNRNRFSKEKQVYKIQHCIVPDWNVAKDALSQLRNGEAFYTIAKNLGKKYTTHEVGKDDVDAQLWGYLNGMKTWNIRVVEQGNQLKIVQLMEKKKKIVPIPFQSLKDSLSTVLLENKRSDYISHAIDSLNIYYKVRIHE